MTIINTERQETIETMEMLDVYKVSKFFKSQLQEEMEFITQCALLLNMRRNNFPSGGSILCKLILDNLYVSSANSNAVRFCVTHNLLFYT